MEFRGDYHTHTVYSHGKGSIEDNVLRAAKKGLAEIAITDHGFNHITYGVRRRELKAMRAQLDLLKIKYPQVKTYLGVEANILDSRGHIDVLSEDKPKLDIIVCGYHKFVLSGALPYFAGNNFGSTSARTSARNTEAYINALERNDIDILSHPGNFCKCDIREVARACKHFGTYFELNGKRILISDDELAEAADEGCEFICDSDAHKPGRVGDFSASLAAIERVGIPLESVANYKRLPRFRSGGGGRT